MKVASSSGTPIFIPTSIVKSSTGSSRGCLLIDRGLRPASSLFRSRHSLPLENLARQQFAVLKRHHPDPKLDLFDKLFWLLVRRLWLPINSVCIQNQHD